MPYKGLNNLYIIYTFMTKLAEALHYKPDGRGFGSRWCHLNFSLT
jgi:hypothetical protein